MAADGHTAHSIGVFTDDVPPGDYRLTFTARSGEQTELREGQALSQYSSRDALPVGQSLIQGVNPWNGGLTVSRTDLFVPGRGVPLNFNRTYSSNGVKTPGALGPGWSHAYESKVIITPCGEAIVIGGEGSGMRFVSDGEGVFTPLRGYHGSLVANAEDGSFDFYTIGGNRYRYAFAGDREWLLSEISDPNGNTTSLEYGPGADGVRLLAVSDSAGRQLVLRYEYRRFPLYEGELLVEVAGPDGLRISYEYDGDGNLARASRESGALVESYGYEQVPGLDHELRSILNQVRNELSGAETRYTYTSSEIGVGDDVFPATLVIGVQQPEGGVTLFDYDEDALAERATSATTAVTDRVGEITVLEFDRYGTPRSIEDPEGHRSTMEWDLERVLMLSRTDDALGERTRFTYDANGQVSVEEVAGYTRLRAYAPPSSFDPPYLKNRLISSIDRNGHETTFEYDAHGNLLEETIEVEDAAGAVSTVRRRHVYAANGDRLSTTDARGLVTHFEYDAAGNLVRLIDPQGYTVEKTYDVRGRLVRQVDANGEVTTMTYDGLGRLLETVHPDGERQTIAYDDAGRTRTETDPNGNTTVIEYDLEGRVTRLRNGEGAIAEYAYDAEGRKTGETTWHDEETPRFDFTYEYDGAGRVVRRVEPLGRETLYVVDPVGNITRETLLGGGVASATAPRVTTTAYDALYRPIAVSRQLDGRDITTTFTWDGEGNKLSETDPLGRLRAYDYDALNRQVRAAGPGGQVVERSFDGEGHLVREVTANDSEDHIRRFVYDDSGRLAEQIDATGARRTFEYDPAGNLVHETDPLGRSIKHAYDSRNRPIARTVVTARHGEIVTTYRYDGNGNLVGETWPNGNPLTHTYDGLDRLVRSVDSLGPLVEYEYDARSNRVRQQDANGEDTLMTYDALDRLRVVEAPEDRTLTLDYDLIGNLVRAVDAKGRATTLDYDTLDRVIQVTDPEPFAYTSHFDYDDVGNVIARTNRRGFTTSIEYDALDRPVRIVDPPTGGEATEVTRGYDIVGNLIEEVDRRGVVNRFRYDLENRRLESRRDGVRLETLSYDGNGNVRTITDANDNVTTLGYDERDLLIERLRPGGVATRYVYDEMGDRTRVTDPSGREVRYIYDLRRRAESEARNAGTEVTRFEFDGNGNRIRLERPEGGVWRWEFDGAGRLGAVVDPEAGRTEYSYGPTDTLDAVLDAEGRTTSFEYDALDRLTRKIEPGGAAERYGFDAAGNLTSLEDAKGQLFAYDYDARDRQVARTYPSDPSVSDALESIAFTYDGNNNLLRIVEELSLSGAQTTTRTYDSFDRLQSTTDRWGHRLSYAYDANGNRTQLIDPDGEVTSYAYDALNRMASVSVSGGGVTTYRYLANGLLEEIESPNGTSASFAHDQANRIETIINRHGASQVSSFEYSYDRNGNRTGQVESQLGLGVEVTSYTYDLADRLLSVTYPEKVASYTYDAVGNRSSEREESTSDGTVLASKSYVYDERDHLTQVLDQLEPSKTAVYGYDANGNQISRQIGAGPVTEFVFDVRDQLVRIEDDGSPTGAYRYDFQGLRIQKDTAAGQSRYVYDDRSVLKRYGPTSHSKYEYGPDRLLSVNDTSQGRAYYLLDGLGSVSNLVGEGGTQLAQYRWDAWGNPRQQTDNPANPFGYTGHEMDEESGLIYMKARFYDPSTGRFLSHDPLEGDPRNPPSLHRYLYAFQNPTVYTDPTGLAPEEAQEEDGENRGIFSGLRDTLENAFGADKNRETAERADEEIGGAAGAVAGVLLGAASFVAEAADTALAAAETVHEVIAAGAGSEAAQERLDRKIEAAGTVIQAIAEDPVGAGMAIVDGVVEVGQGAARGDAGAIHDASTALFGALAGGGALQAAGATRAAAAGVKRGAQAAQSAATKAAGAAATAGRATQAAVKQATDAGRDAVRSLRQSNLTQSATAGLTRARQPLGHRLKTSAGKPKGKQCFVAGTLVWIEGGGLVPIETLRVDDRVVSRNPITGELSINRVAQLFVTENRPILEVEVETAAGDTEVFETTPEHPFFDEHSREILAKNLRPGDGLGPDARGETGLTVRQVRGSPKTATVYNFEVENDHTYFVGQAGVWVHNDCETELSQDTFDRLAFDPAKGKISQASIEELRTGLAAEKAGLIDRITDRGIPGQRGEPGFEFSTQSGRRVDVKAFRAQSLRKPKEARKLKLKSDASPEVDFLLDPRNLTDAELDSVIQRAVDAGIDRSRLLVVPRERFSDIKVGDQVFKK